MTPEELQTKPEWLRLPPKWRAFVLEIIKDGNRVRAAEAVYPKHSSPAVCGAALLGREQIIACLTRYYGLNPLALVHQKMAKELLQLTKKARKSGKITPALLKAEVFYSN